jgi:hypothetical protein
VAAVATEQTGSEGEILRFVFVHSLVLAGLVGLLTLVQAYVVPGMIPVNAGNSKLEIRINDKAPMTKGVK